MRKLEVYAAGTGLGLLFVGLGAVAIQHDRVPGVRFHHVTEHTVSAPAGHGYGQGLSGVAVAFEKGQTPAPAPHENTALTNTEMGIAAIGFLIFAMAIVPDKDGPARQRPVSPVDIPLQASAETAISIRNVSDTV